MRHKKYMWLISIISAILAAFLSRHLAKKKGRSERNWFLLGLFFGWLSPLILYFLSPLSSIKGEEKPIPPPPALEEKKEWFYIDKAFEQKGPITLNELKALYKTAALSEQSYIWREGMEDWKKICDGAPFLRE